MHFFYQDNTSFFILISLLDEAYIYSFDLFIYKGLEETFTKSKSLFT